MKHGTPISIVEHHESNKIEQINITYRTMKIDY